MGQESWSQGFQVQWLFQTYVWLFLWAFYRGCSDFRWSQKLWMYQTDSFSSMEYAFSFNRRWILFCYEPRLQQRHLTIQMLWFTFMTSNLRVFTKSLIIKAWSPWRCIYQLVPTWKCSLKAMEVCYRKEALSISVRDYYYPAGGLLGSIIGVSFHCIGLWKSSRIFLKVRSKLVEKKIRRCYYSSIIHVFDTDHTSNGFTSQKLCNKH